MREMWGKLKESGNVICHLRGGLHFIELTETTARTIGSGLFYAAAPGENGELPMLDHPVHYTEYHERFVKTATGWKLQHRRSVDIMRNRPPGWPKSFKR